MGGNNDSRRERPLIGAAAKAAFLSALRGGARREDAAAASGFSLMGFYGARQRDPSFASDWKEALAVSAGSRPRLAAKGGETRIVPANRRLFQRRKMRNVRFDEQRRQIFLAHFAWSCDTRAAAAEAGVHESTVNLHRRTDPAFEAEFRDALDRGYVLLEAEALRQRLEAQRRLREALDASDPPRGFSGRGTGEAGGGAPPSGPWPATSPRQAGGGLEADIAAEFERVLKLLARWDRKARRPDATAAPGGRRVWTFEGAIELLDKRLKALGHAVPPLPPDLAGRYDGSPEEGAQ